MNIPSEDIIAMLIAESGLNLEFASSASRNIFEGKEPAMPINSVTVFDTVGYPPALGLGSFGYEYPSVQIRIRNKSYPIGLGLAQDIKNSLHGRSHETWNGTLYTVISCASGPALLDWDEKGNARFIINFNLQRRAV